MSFTKILVPVDFSPQSAEAVRMAAELSRRFEARVTLVHVLQPVSYLVPEGYSLFTTVQLSDLQRAVDAHLTAAKKDAEAAGAIGVDTKQLAGIPALEINALAAHGAFDLIVMGTHGRSGLPHMVMGSVAERVVRQALCPVLTVRSPAPPNTRASS